MFVQSSKKWLTINENTCFLRCKIYYSDKKIMMQAPCRLNPDIWIVSYAGYWFEFFDIRSKSARSKFFCYSELFIMRRFNF
jgi:hypothetical protein